LHPCNEAEDQASRRDAKVSALHYLMAMAGRNGRAFQSEQALRLAKCLSKAHWRSAVVATRISVCVAIATSLQKSAPRRHPDESRDPVLVCIACSDRSSVQASGMARIHRANRKNDAQSRVHVSSMAWLLLINTAFTILTIAGG
jgi:anti-sigma-K factor RskA